MKSFYTEQKKIPAPLAIVIIIILFFLFSLVFRRSSQTSIDNNGVNLLSSYEITNLNGGSAAIVMCVSKKIPLKLILTSVGAENTSMTIYDDRDVPENLEPRMCHYFSLKNIANGKYVVKPISNNLLITKKPIYFQTGEPLTAVKAPPLWGKIVDKLGNPLETGIVVAYFDNARPVSALIKHGDWLLPIHYLGLVPGADTKFRMVFTDQNGEKTQITSAYKMVDEVSKTVVLGKNYDFTHSSEIGQSVLGQQTDKIPELKKIDIIYPQSNAIIPSFRPLFKGVAMPNKKVILTVDEFSTVSKKSNSKDKIYEVLTNNTGVWTFTPSNDLQSGFHNLAIKTEDESGKNVTVKNYYTILKSGEQVLGDATASATLTPTELPITPTDTIPFPTPESTEVPTVTVVPLPRSGMDIYPVTIMSASFIILGAGLLFFYL